MYRHHAWADAAWVQGLVVVATYAALLVTAATGYAGGLGLTPWHLPLALAVGVGCATAYALPRLGARTTLGAIGLALAVLALAAWASAELYDTAWDSRDYHRRAAMLFADGFNPYRALAEPQSAYYNWWINHFPRGPWIWNAAAIAATGSLEIGKAIDLWLVWGVFGTAVAVLLPALPARPGTASAIALLLAANPIAIGQSFTNYVDGQGAALLTLVVLGVVAFVQTPTRTRTIFAAATIVLALNVKFTVTGLLGLWFGATILALWSVPRPPAWVAQRRAALTVLLVVASGVGLAGIGWSPYVRNTVQFGHPFYPIFGRGTPAVDPEQIDATFRALPRGERVLRSLLAPSDNDVHPGRPSMKRPFAVRAQEITAFRDPDVRIGGFGPWFGWTFALALIALVVHRREPGVGWATIAVAACLLPAFLNDGGWWARFHPQLWLAPVSIAAVLLVSERRLARWSGALLAVLLVVNTTFVGIGRAAHAVRERTRINALLGSLAREGRTIYLYPAMMVGAEYLLAKHRIPFIIVADSADIPCTRSPLIGPELISRLPCPTP